MNRLISESVLVLVPVYNEEANLDLLIMAVRNQTFKNFTLVIQDNCSTDRSLQIALEHQKLDSRLKVVALPHPVSAETNWFTMPESVKDLLDFTYCTWLGGDDLWSDSRYLENLVSELKNRPEIGAICPTFQIVSPRGAPIKTIYPSAHSPLASKRVMSLCRNWDEVHHIYALYRAPALQELLSTKTSRFNSYLGSDWWWTYTFLSCHRSAHCPSSTYLKVLDVGNATPNVEMRGKLNTYLNSLKAAFKPEIQHLRRVTLVRKRFFLAAVVVFFYSKKSLKKFWTLHHKILSRRIKSLGRHHGN